MKLLAILSLLLLTSNSYAGPVKLTASGSVNPNEFISFGTDAFCCIDELKIFEWEFTSTFNFDDFITPDFFTNQPFFNNGLHQSTTIIDGKTAPKIFNQGPEDFSLVHGLASYSSGDYIVSQFQFTMGVGFDQATRFMITDHLYIREMSISGYRLNFYESIDEALNPEKLKQALIADTSQFSPTFRFLIGDANKPDDNIAIGSFLLGSIDYFNIDPVNVPEPNSVILLLLACLALVTHRTRNTSR